MNEDRKFRIAVVANIAWHLYNFRMGLIESLEKAGYEVILMAGPDEYVSRLKETGKHFVPLYHLQRTGRNPLKDIKLLQEIINKYRKHKIDLALHYTSKANIYGSIASGRLGIISINTINGLGGPFSARRVVTQRIIKRLYRYALQYGSRVFFQNDHDRSFFINQHIVNPKRTVLVDGTGINIERFDPKLFPPRREDGKIVFLMFSRLSREKGVIQYVEAAKILRSKFSNLEFQLAGPFDQDELAIPKSKIEKWQEEGAIRYLGVSDFIQQEISQADVIVYPSYYMEGLPRALLESLSMAKPIITTDHVGCKETVMDGKNGYLVPVKNTAALAMIMERFVRLSDEERLAMGIASRQLAQKRFDERIIINEYLKAITTTLDCKFALK